ncbi:hypothetical protein NLI96_g8366 [Meripilus lineatus]|uniref:Uncharacterized protein n=1 Tax=Meripilus lineatus TaxID=2056292 RepID=A0AAD5UXH7_9APHY|nr:hypothetical protein NLI96_g8366 [Physisporinus lineatus]
MEEDHEFKMPSMIPQDLQLIQDLIGDDIPKPLPIISATAKIEVEASSDDDSDSEKEVEANILGGIEDEEDSDRQKVPPSESTSDSESSMDASSDSDSSDDEGESKLRVVKDEALAVDDDEESGPAITSEAQVRTKNEVVDSDVVVPDIEEIPTTERLEKVRFSQKFPLDAEKVKVSREVFHVPTRSKFVFVNQIKAFKGSDASNAHDEEPGDDELDFSDDEAERAHKRAMEQRPYDDPYSDTYGIEEVPPSSSTKSPRSESSRDPPTTFSPPRGRGRGSMYSRDFSGGRQDRGRGRGRDRQRPDRGRGRGRGGQRRNSEDTRRRSSFSSHSEQNAPVPRSLSPTSLAIARATGQYADGSSFAPAPTDYEPYPQDTQGYSPVSGLENGWGYPSYPGHQSSSYYSNSGDYQTGFDQPQQYVQPHINPRFASAFGFGVGGAGFSQPAQYGYDQYGGGEYGYSEGDGWQTGDGTNADSGLPPSYSSGNLS